MPSAGFELGIRARDRPQTFALDRLGTGIDIMSCYFRVKLAVGHFAHDSYIGESINVFWSASSWSVILVLLTSGPLLYTCIYCVFRGTGVPGMPCICHLHIAHKMFKTFVMAVHLT